jgi:hypothetical protein
VGNKFSFSYKHHPPLRKEPPIFSPASAEGEFRKENIMMKTYDYNLPHAALILNVKGKVYAF